MTRKCVLVAMAPFDIGIFRLVSSGRPRNTCLLSTIGLIRRTFGYELFHEGFAWLIDCFNTLGIW